MAWRSISQPTKNDAAERKRRKKSRFLVDESLGVGVALVLRSLKLNAVFVGEVRLTGHDDRDVFSYAWRERRILLTHDRDFLDDSRFPENRNPGLAVILAGADGNQRDMQRAIGHVCGLFKRGPEHWIGKKVIISVGEIQIRGRDRNTGRFVTDRYDISGPGVRKWGGD